MAKERRGKVSRIRLKESQDEKAWIMSLRVVLGSMDRHLALVLAPR